MVPLESYVNFSCIAEGVDPSWFINGLIVDGISTRNFMANGFWFHPISHAGYNHTLTMSVWASLQNNNTVIKCRVYGIRSSRLVEFSPPAKLIAMGMQWYQYSYYVHVQ